MATTVAIQTNGRPFRPSTIGGAETQPDRPGYANEWPFGPEDTVDIVLVNDRWPIPTGNKNIPHVMTTRRIGR